MRLVQWKQISNLVEDPTSLSVNFGNGLSVKGLINNYISELDVYDLDQF